MLYLQQKNYMHFHHIHVNNSPKIRIMNLNTIFCQDQGPHEYQMSGGSETSNLPKIDPSNPKIHFLLHFHITILKSQGGQLTRDHGAGSLIIRFHSIWQSAFHFAQISQKMNPYYDKRVSPKKLVKGFLWKLLEFIINRNNIGKFMKQNLMISQKW